MSKEICEGDMRTPVSFGKEQTVADGVGGQAVTFLAIVQDAFCKVENISEREEFKTGARRAVSTFKMTLRFNAEIVSKMQVRWGNAQPRSGRIVGEPNNIEERDEWMIIKVEVNDGE